MATRPVFRPYTEDYAIASKLGLGKERFRQDRDGGWQSEEDHDQDEESQPEPDSLEFEQLPPDSSSILLVDSDRLAIDSLSELGSSQPQQMHHSYLASQVHHSPKKLKRYAHVVEEDDADLSFDLDWEQHMEERPIVALRHMKQELYEVRKRYSATDGIRTSSSMQGPLPQDLPSSDVSQPPYPNLDMDMNLTINMDMNVTSNLDMNRDLDTSGAVFDGGSQIEYNKQHSLDSNQKTSTRKTNWNGKVREFDQIDRMWQRRSRDKGQQSGSRSRSSNSSVSTRKQAPKRRTENLNGEVLVLRNHQRQSAANNAQQVRGRAITGRNSAQSVTSNKRLTLTRLPTEPPKKRKTVHDRHQTNAVPSRNVELEIKSYKYRRTRMPAVLTGPEEMEMVEPLSSSDVSADGIDFEEELPAISYSRARTRPSSALNIPRLGAYLDRLLDGEVITAPNSKWDPVLEDLEDEYTRQINTLRSFFISGEHVSAVSFVEFCQFLGSSIANGILDESQKKVVLRSNQQMLELWNEYESCFDDNDNPQYSQVEAIILQVVMIVTYVSYRHYQADLVLELETCFNKAIAFLLKHGTEVSDIPALRDTAYILERLSTTISGSFDMERTLQYDINRKSHTAGILAIFGIGIVPSISLTNAWKALHSLVQIDQTLVDGEFLSKCVFAAKYLNTNDPWSSAMTLAELLNRIVEEKRSTNKLYRPRLAPIVNFDTALASNVEHSESEYEVFLRFLTCLLQRDPSLGVGRLRPIVITEESQGDGVELDSRLTNQINLLLVLHIYCSRAKSRPSIDKVLGLKPLDQCSETIQRILFEAWMTTYQWAHKLDRLDTATTALLTTWLSKFMNCRGDSALKWRSYLLKRIQQSLPTSTSHSDWCGMVCNEEFFNSLQYVLQTKGTNDSQTQNYAESLLEMLRQCLMWLSKVPSANKDLLNHFQQVIGKGLWTTLGNLLDEDLPITSNSGHLRKLERLIDAWAIFVCILAYKKRTRWAELTSSSLSWSSFREGTNREKYEVFWAYRLLKRLPLRSTQEPSIRDYLVKCLLVSIVYKDRYSKQLQRTLRQLGIIPLGFEESASDTKKLRLMIRWLRTQPTGIWKSCLAFVFQTNRMKEPTPVMADLVQLVTEIFPDYSHPALVWTRNARSFHPLEAVSFEVAAMRKNFRTERPGILEGYLLAMLTKQDGKLFTNVITRGALLEAHDVKFALGWNYFCNVFAVVVLDQYTANSCDFSVAFVLLHSIVKVVVGLDSRIAHFSRYEGLTTGVLRYAVSLLRYDTVSITQWAILDLIMDLLQTLVLNSATADPHNHDNEVYQPSIGPFLTAIAHVSESLLLNKRLTEYPQASSTAPPHGQELHLPPLSNLKFSLPQDLSRKRSQQSTIRKAFRCVLNLQIAVRAVFGAHTHIPDLNNIEELFGRLHRGLAAPAGPVGGESSTSDYYCIENDDLFI